MKTQKGKKLHLGKETIQNLDSHPERLAREDQEAIKGGINGNSVLTTVVPIFCEP